MLSKVVIGVAALFGFRVVLYLEGQPAKVFRAGETFQLPADLVHRTTAGPAGAEVVAAWVHIPGKQFNFPASD
jgi:quercetin dioxygenase-like cupin family protein